MMHCGKGGKRAGLHDIKSEGTHNNNFFTIKTLQNRLFEVCITFNVFPEAVIKFKVGIFTSE